MRSLKTESRFPRGRSKGLGLFWRPGRVGSGRILASESWLRKLYSGSGGAMRIMRRISSVTKPIAAGRTTPGSTATS
jgi:hypothetical protein